MHLHPIGRLQGFVRYCPASRCKILRLLFRHAQIAVSLFVEKVNPDGEAGGVQC